MKSSSAKGKGRRLQQEVRDLLLETFKSLEPDDVRSTGMGQSGVDIQLSPAAKKQIPFSIECKNQEGISIWACMAQAEKNVLPKTFPTLVFKRNRSKTYACLELETFIKIIKNTDFSKVIEENPDIEQK